MGSEPARFLRAAFAASLTVSALFYFVFSWRWPLVGDASLIHYIAFLIERGWAPYRQLGDMNMPGSFLIELAAMHVFGYGDLAWRIFDFTLLAASTAAFFTLAGRKRWLAGLFAASLFVLIHGRDGLAEGGQRDLTMAVCLLAATAFLCVAMRRALGGWGLLLPVALFGLFSGIAATIKPTAVLLTIAQLAIAVWLRPAAATTEDAGQRDRPIGNALHSGLLTAAVTTYLIAPSVAILFLLRERALAAFLDGLHTIVPYYASLGHKPLGFVLMHSLSPLLPLVIAWLVVAALIWSKEPLQWERTVLLAGVLFGFINCILQQRALPYYRYPLLVFLLPLMALDFTAAFTREPARTAQFPPRARRCSQIVAALALAYGSLFLAPQSAVLIHRYRWWETDFISTLRQNLTTLGGPALSGHIQCIDSISGCGNVLYRLRLEPATGVLSDFLLFGAVTDRQPPDAIPVIARTRAEFSATILSQPPKVIVVTSHLHMDGPDNFQKLSRWPAFADFLASRYDLATEWHPHRTARWWSREETPASYRIYVLRNAQPDAHP